jgi:DNA repair ATPase RecN
MDEARYLKYLVGSVQALHNMAHAVFSPSVPSSGFFDIRGTQKVRYYIPALGDALRTIDLMEDEELQQRSQLLVQRVKDIEQLYQRFVDLIARFLKVPATDDPSRLKLRDKVNRYARKHGPDWVDESAYRELMEQTAEAWKEADEAKKAVEERLEQLVSKLEASGVE